jgi:hydroxymethylpyrimidine pyrophosphatase-like HAD family hydrolase
MTTVSTSPRTPRLLALCCDYDGTVAHHGVLDAATEEALRRVAASGRRVLLVTGRELDDLRRVLGRLDLFDCIVAENGALLYTPSTNEEKPLADPPREAFVRELQGRGVDPLSVGRCIVATWEPHDAVVLDVIREQGLELQVIFNKGAVMVLPAGVNKASGLVEALDSLGLSAHNAVGIGDAQNDHAFLAQCQMSVAVANALPSLKEEADFVTPGDHGEGVRQLVEELLRDDMTSIAPRVRRHRIEIGTPEGGEPLAIAPQDSVMLIIGRSGSGKSTVAKALLERLVEQAYSFCVVDPEGDYEGLADAVTLGTQDHAITTDEAMQAIERRGNVVLNLLGIALEDRPAFLASLLPLLGEHRARTGQPHWLVIDEAHHMMAKKQAGERRPAAQHLDGLVLLTVHPEMIEPEVFEDVNALIVVGSGAADEVRGYGKLSGRSLGVRDDEAELEQGKALVWLAEAGDEARRVTLVPGRGEHLRHSRKYAEGELPEDRSFYFRGPQGKLKLRAQNLVLFMQMADGVDDETWLHHLRQGDYSRWFSRDIKNDVLGEEARKVEAEPELDPRESRARMRAAIERLYTLPA